MRRRSSSLQVRTRCDQIGRGRSARDPSGDPTPGSSATEFAFDVNGERQPLETKNADVAHSDPIPGDGTSVVLKGVDSTEWGLTQTWVCRYRTTSVFGSCDQPAIGH